MNELHQQALVIASELLARPAGSADSADIGERMGLDKQEAAALVKELEGAGYVIVWPDPAFGPTWTITSLTSRGQSVVSAGG